MKTLTTLLTAAIVTATQSIEIPDTCQVSITCNAESDNRCTDVTLNVQSDCQIKIVNPSEIKRVVGRQ